MHDDTPLPNERRPDRPSTTVLGEDDWYRLLAPARRRIALDIVTNGPTPVDLDALAVAVAEREGIAADPDAVRRATIDLHHNHLPRMARHGLVEYDTTSRRVEAAVGQLPGLGRPPTPL